MKKTGTDFISSSNWIFNTCFCTGFLQIETFHHITNSIHPIHYSKDTESYTGAKSEWRWIDWLCLHAIFSPSAWRALEMSIKRRAFLFTTIQTANLKVARILWAAFTAMRALWWSERSWWSVVCLLFAHKHTIMAISHSCRQHTHFLCIARASIYSF